MFIKNCQFGNRMFTFTKNELEIFRAVCLENKSVSDIVESTAPSSKTVYRLVETIEKDGLVRKQGERGARFAPSTDLHAVALKKYVLSDGRPLDAIVGSRLLVLLSISNFPKGIKRIAKETKLKQETVRVLIWSLRTYGIVMQEGSKIKISPTDTFMIQFLQDFSRGANLKIMEEKTKVGAMLWSDGLEFIFSAPSLSDPVGVKKTGITAMAEYGLDFISETNYYYYAYWHPDLKVEDVAIHNLLIGPNSVRNISYSILLLKKTGYDRRYLTKEARCVGINKLVREVLDIAEGKEVANPFLPSKMDMESLYAQYGVP